MKEFEEFVRKGIIKKQSANLSISRDLLEESERKYNSLKIILGKIGLKEENANDIVEYCYDILIGLVRAKLHLDGYKSSGGGAHEAEISYIIQLGFSETDARIMDELRYFRNGIKYYGKRFSVDYAKKIIDFLEKNYERLRRLINII